MFGCGMYRIEWYNAKGDIVKSVEKYLTYQGYNQEVMEMQMQALKGVDVASLKATPL